MRYSLRTSLQLNTYTPTCLGELVSNSRVISMRMNLAQVHLMSLSTARVNLMQASAGKGIYISFHCSTCTPNCSSKGKQNQ